MGKTYLQSVRARYGGAAVQQPVFQAPSRTFLMMNPPSHTRLRALLMETTSNMIGNAMVALFRQPARLDELKCDPALVPQAVAECIRYDGSVQMVVRTALEEVVIDGEALSPGTIVFMLIGAANRDPAVLRNPDQLDFLRGSGAPSLSFGGIHYCLGARFALLEMEAAIGGLLARFPAMRPVDLD
jgi:cytochrome P450